MDKYTAQEEAYKRGRESGMNWVSVTDKPFRPEYGKIYLVWGWDSYYGDDGEVRMELVPEVVVGSSPGIGRLDNVVHWMEIKKPSDE